MLEDGDPISFEQQKRYFGIVDHVASPYQVSFYEEHTTSEFIFLEEVGKIREFIDFKSLDPIPNIFW